VNALLCSDRADALAGPPIFPDQVVVIGRRGLLVPYSDPGLVLARDVRVRLAEHAREWGMPRVIYLRNHGLVVLGSSGVEALQLTEMADKVSRVLGATLALGRVVPMADESVERMTHVTMSRYAVPPWRARWRQPETIE
jgi:rhamnose utilization protein RhaD (predicted bifunctional aldolase and dehydrogenase)